MIRDMLSSDMPAALAGAVSSRSAIFDMIDEAEAAVLRPNEPGGISREMRHALAARIALQGGQDALAARYGSGLSGALAALAEGGESADPVVIFMDRVATQTRDVTAREVADLIAGGVAEADVVRLCELNAFVSFQLRLLAGLRLMEGKS